jgi:hypothetical protein
VLQQCGNCGLLCFFLNQSGLKLLPSAKIV